jgi:hypothetical protein
MARLVIPAREILCPRLIGTKWPPTTPRTDDPTPGRVQVEKWEYEVSSASGRRYSSMSVVVFDFPLPVLEVLRTAATTRLAVGCTEHSEQNDDARTPEETGAKTHRAWLGFAWLPRNPQPLEYLLAMRRLEAIPGMLFDAQFADQPAPTHYEFVVPLPTAPDYVLACTMMLDSEIPRGIDDLVFVKAGASLLLELPAAEPDTMEVEVIHGGVSYKGTVRRA